VFVLVLKLCSLALHNRRFNAANVLHEHDTKSLWVRLIVDFDRITEFFDFGFIHVEDLGIVVPVGDPVPDFDHIGQRGFHSTHNNEVTNGQNDTNIVVLSVLGRHNNHTSASIAYATVFQ